ncbi:hypothetical protein MMC25_006295 [Agyrium rufum]|nr:hypothetical protein [Agyrium rufum]
MNSSGKQSSEYNEYSKVLDSEEQSLNLPLRPAHTSRAVRLRRWAAKSYTIALHILLVITCTITAYQSLHTEAIECFSNPLDAPIIWEDKTINTRFNGTFIDSYAGSNPITDAKWDALLEVGIIRLTPEEEARLPIKTVPLYGDEEGYAGFIETFHQLHCLNRIRKHFYEPTANLDGNQTAEFTRFHDEHCFDYIRQNLMCTADTNVLPISWDTRIEGYSASFDTTVQKKCRNFESIYGWAKSRRSKHIPPGNGGEKIAGYPLQVPGADPVVFGDGTRRPF